jgi:hypothetical protein
MSGMSIGWDYTPRASAYPAAFLFLPWIPLPENLLSAPHMATLFVLGHTLAPTSPPVYAAFHVGGSGVTNAQRFYGA